MEKEVLKYAPAYWDKDGQGDAIRREFIIFNKRCSEYMQLNFEVRNAVVSRKSCKSIRRNQNVQDFGQLLKREQFLTNKFSFTTVYKVRRFAVVKQKYLEDALDYNLDPRRCGLPEVKLSKHVIDVLDDEVLLIFQVLTCDLVSFDIKPKKSSEYMIEYIVEINQKGT